MQRKFTILKTLILVFCLFCIRFSQAQLTYNLPSEVNVVTDLVADLNGKRFFDIMQGVEFKGQTITCGDQSKVEETYGGIAQSTNFRITSITGNGNADFKLISSNGEFTRIEMPENPSQREYMLTLNFSGVIVINVNGWIDFSPSDRPCVADVVQRRITPLSSYTIKFIVGNSESLIPGKDFTVDKDLTCGDESIKVTLVNGHPKTGSTYRLRSIANTDVVVSSFTGSSTTLLPSQLDRLTSIGKAQFIITEKKSNQFETIDVSPAFVQGITRNAVPSAPSIRTSDLHEVCYNDYDQGYVIEDLGNFSQVRFSCQGCLSSSRNGSTINVRWNAASSNHSLTVGGTAITGCSAIDKVHLITVNNDLQFFSVEGAHVCNGELGSIALGGSQFGLIYVLFKKGTQEQVSEGIVGSGQALSWNDILPGAYEVRVVHPDCGQYVVGSADIVERQVSPAPITFGNPSRCGDGLHELQAGTGNISDEFVFYEKKGSVYTELGRSTVRDGQSSFEVNATNEVNTFGVSYIDEFGCESHIRDVEVNLLNKPEIEIVSNPTICSYESGVSIQNFITKGRNGTASGDIVANNKIFPSLVDEYDRTYTIDYFLPSSNGCSNSTSFELYITALPVVELLNDRVEQCVDNGTYDLRNNVFTDNGNNIVFMIDGDIISGSLINLAGYDLGEHEITIDIDGENSCENEQSFILEINAPNEIVIPLTDLRYCPDFTEISLLDVFSGYTGEFKVNGTAVSDGILLQESDVWKSGDNELTFTEDQACEFEQIYNLYIEEVPVLDIGGDLFVCEEDGEIDLMFIDRNGTIPVAPSGGEWTGRFENRNSFNANAAVNGRYVMTYTVEVNGCSYSASKNVIVNQTPNVFVGGDFSLCRNSQGFDLRSLPNISGGVWEGSLAIGERDIYYPNLEDESLKVVTLTYTFTDNNLCSGNDELRISLTDVPIITTSVSSYSFCVNDDPYDVLSDVKEGGVSVKSEDGGISAGRIFPDIMGVGTHEIVIEREVNGCSNNVTIPVDIRGADNIVFEEQSICVNDPTINLLEFLPTGSPVNGQFAGKGIFEGNKIVPEDIGSGTEFYNYSVKNESECNVEGTLRLVIHPAPIRPEVDEIYYSCADGNTFEINVNNPNENHQYTWYNENDKAIGQGSTLSVSDDLSFSGYVVATSDQMCTTRSEDFEVLSGDLNGSGRSLPEDEVKTGEWIQFFNDIEAFEYEWRFSNGVRSTDKNPIVVFNDVNKWVFADLTVISEFGCTRTYDRIDSVYVIDSDNEYVITNPTRENDGLVLKQNETKFSLYPTPTNSPSVTLSFQSIIDEKVEIKIYNMMNKSLVEGTFYDVVKGDNDLVIDISEFPVGMFIVRVIGSQWKKSNFLVGVKTSR